MMLKCKRQEASLVTVAAENAGLSERTSGCRRMQGCVHFSKASRSAESSLPHSIHRVTEALERLMEEDAAADRPFIAALAISSKARGTSHKPYTLLTAFNPPHILTRWRQEVSARRRSRRRQGGQNDHHLGDVPRLL